MLRARGTDPYMLFDHPNQARNTRIAESASCKADEYGARKHPRVSRSRESWRKKARTTPSPSPSCLQ